MYTHPMQKDANKDSLYELCEKKFKVNSNSLSKNKTR